VPNQPVHVTIVVPTFSAEATLERALRSVLNQSMHEIEVIVVDDASTDSSWNLIRALALEDPRVRGVLNKTNCGKPVGMNRAITLARRTLAGDPRRRRLVPSRAAGRADRDRRTLVRGHGGR